MTTQPNPEHSSTSLRRVLVPLALAQFICSFAGSNMNVMITDISEDLDTTVQGVQIAITIFLLVMAALMIPAGKLTDRYGRKRCFTLGLLIYGVGAVISALSPGLGVLIIGNSILEGIGTALLIPPVYILTTLLFTDLNSRARAFGVISAMGGIGAAAGPLIGGLITSAISWRAAFIFQALVIAVIIWLARGIKDPLPADPTRHFDVSGAVLSAAGLVLVVLGILAADNNGWLMVALIVAGAVVLGAFFVSVRSKERAGKEPLLSSACSAIEPPTSDSSPRTLSGFCSWVSRSWSRPTCRSSGATTPSKPASSSPRPPWESWSRHSPPNGSPRSTPREPLSSSVSS